MYVMKQITLYTHKLSLQYKLAIESPPLLMVASSPLGGCHWQASVKQQGRHPHTETPRRHLGNKYFSIGVSRWAQHSVNCQFPIYLVPEPLTSWVIFEQDPKLWEHSCRAPGQLLCMVTRRLHRKKTESQARVAPRKAFTRRGFAVGRADVKN